MTIQSALLTTFGCFVAFVALMLLLGWLERLRERILTANFKAKAVKPPKWNPDIVMPFEGDREALRAKVEATWKGDAK